jgi:hypothetical protein
MAVAWALGDPAMLGLRVISLGPICTPRFTRLVFIPGPPVFGATRRSCVGIGSGTSYHSGPALLYPLSAHRLLNLLPLSQALVSPDFYSLSFPLSAFLAASKTLLLSLTQVSIRHSSATFDVQFGYLISKIYSIAMAASSTSSAHAEGAPSPTNLQNEDTIKQENVHTSSHKRQKSRHRASVACASCRDRRIRVSLPSPCFHHPYLIVELQVRGPRRGSRVHTMQALRG